MAHFYGSVQGSRGEVHRLGGRNTGLRTVAKGWEFGVDVYLYHDDATGRDFAKVYQTKGSASPGGSLQEFVLRTRPDGTPETDVNGLVKFAEAFLKEFGDAADVNAANRRLVAQARKLLGVDAKKKK